MYERTHDALWKQQATRFTNGIGSQATHSSGDLGFMFMTSYGNAYRLTGKAQYRTKLLKAARTLAARYEPGVGAIRSWGQMGTPQVKVIVDTLMNLDLLFWASAHGGDASWAVLARQHALTTLRDHVRGDGSVFHVVTYDRATGAVLSRTNQQGASDSSTWSRGQAWALHGFAVAYAATGDAQLLTGARRTADYYLDHLPGDAVPYWDFQAPGIPSAPKDSSAAAIAAAGLFKLASVDPTPASAPATAARRSASSAPWPRRRTWRRRPGSTRSCSRARCSSATARSTAASASATTTCCRRSRLPERQAAQAPPAAMKARYSSAYAATPSRTSP